MSLETFKNCKLCGEKNIKKINSKFNLVECQNCKLIFCATIFSEKEIIDTYDKIYNKTDSYRHHQKEKILLKNGHQPSLGKSKKRIFKSLINKEKVRSILEIGSGVGITGYYFRSQNIDYTGIEIDKQTAQFAQSIGLNVINDSFLAMEDLKPHYDAVIGFEVIEHLQELDSFLKLAHKKLKNKGILAFTVPNFNKINNYPPSEKLYQDTPPIHINFFTKENIKNILQYNRFEVSYLKVKKFPYFNWKHIATYKFIIKSIFGYYQGPTILCIARKQL